MKAFIGWSGNSSKCVALSLREWLPSVLPYVKPWMSKKDIAKGVIWNTELWKNLKKADFGILCLVPENITKPWVIFEAGALSGGRAYNKVSPFLLGIEPDDLPEPLRQFQCTCFGIEDVRELVLQLNEIAKEKERLSEPELKMLFQAHWPKFRGRLNSIDLTKVEEETEDAIDENNQSATKEEQLDKIHIGILKTLASSYTRWTSFSTLQILLNKSPKLLAIKVNDLVRMHLIEPGRKKQGRHYRYFYSILEKGVRFLDSKGLL